MCNRVERAPAGRVVFGHEPRERLRPGAALCRERGPVQLHETAVNAAASFGHRPVRETLIQVAGQEANERRIDPAISVDAGDGEQPVAMANRTRLGGERRVTGASHRFEARRPQPLHGAPFFTRAVPEFAEIGERRSGIGGDVGAEP